MIRHINAFDLEEELEGEGDNEEEVSYDEIGLCPLCGVAARPLFGSGAFLGDALFVIHACTDCERIFVARYFKKRYSDSIYQFDRTYPPQLDSTIFSKDISAVSPQFVKIYDQAKTAEENGLDELCGLGYRRSLEFLVKDYLCKKAPKDMEAILKEPLGVCIKNRISDLRIKTLAERSAWIGNDEAHYVRKHETLGVPELKRFIRAIVTFIDAEMAVEEALSIEKKS